MPQNVHRRKCRGIAGLASLPCSIGREWDPMRNCISSRMSWCIAYCWPIVVLTRITFKPSRPACSATCRAQHSRLHMIMSCSSRALAALSFSYKTGSQVPDFSVDGALREVGRSARAGYGKTQGQCFLSLGCEEKYAVSDRQCVVCARTVRFKISLGIWWITRAPPIYKHTILFWHQSLGRRLLQPILCCAE